MGFFMRVLLLIPLLFSLLVSYTDQPVVPGQPEQEAVVKPPSYEHALGKMLLTLLGLILLIILTVWMMRRLSSGRLARGNTTQAVKILEKRPLSPKSMLYLLEVDGKRILISESQLEVRPLSEEKTTAPVDRRD